MTWAKNFVETVTSAEFQMLPNFCMANPSFYGRIRAAQEALNDTVEQYTSGKLSDEELFQWVKANVATEESRYARLIDTNPAFRHSTLWGWYSEWWYKLLEDCKGTYPAEETLTPTVKRGRKKKGENDV
jgi:hypothetical protein